MTTNSSSTVCSLKNNECGIQWQKKIHTHCLIWIVIITIILRDCGVVHKLRQFVFTRSTNQFQNNESWIFTNFHKFFDQFEQVLQGSFGLSSSPSSWGISLCLGPFINYVNSFGDKPLTCSWYQKNETTNSRIHQFKVLQNVF